MNDTLRDHEPLCVSAPSDNHGLAAPGDDCAHLTLEQRIDAAIGERLRDAFAPVLNEPIPERFLELLKQLAASEVDR